MDSTADRLGTGQLCRAPDRASSTASGLRGTGINADIRNVPRFDRIRAGRAAGTLSNTGVGDRYISRRRVLLASYPIGRLRRDRVSWIAVVAGGDKLGLTFGSCRAHRDGLKLARTRAAGQCKGRSQDQSEKRKRKAEPLHNSSGKPAYGQVSCAVPTIVQPPPQAVTRSQLVWLNAKTENVPVAPLAH